MAKVSKSGAIWQDIHKTWMENYASKVAHSIKMG
jgi:hypothetical protein